jgi:hypothetical protein
MNFRLPWQNAVLVPYEAWMMKSFTDQLEQLKSIEWENK